MNNWYEIINTALFHNVSTPLMMLAALCVAVVVASVAFAIYEIRHDIS